MIEVLIAELPVLVEGGSQRLAQVENLEEVSGVGMHRIKDTLGQMGIVVCAAVMGKWAKVEDISSRAYYDLNIDNDNVFVGAKPAEVVGQLPYEKIHYAVVEPGSSLGNYLAMSTRVITMGVRNDGVMIRSGQLGWQDVVRYIYQRSQNV